MQRRITTLWALLGAVRAGDRDETDRAAIAAAAALRADGALRLIDDGGVLRADDGALPGADCFAFAQGLAAALHAANVPELAFARDVAPAALEAWAAITVAAADRGCVPGDVAWPGGISAPVRAAAPAGIPAREQQHERWGLAADAHLRSVFLQHELISRLPALRGIAPPAAKFVVQLVVDRLLAVPDGLAPLTMLQRDERALARGTAAAVLAVLLARAAGWPDEHLADIGAAALLHDVGTVLDPTRPGPTAFAWLLERGVTDFWLRCALVARHATDPDNTAAGELPVATVIRLALTAAAALHANPAAAAADLVTAARPSFPPELLAVLPHALGA